MKKTWRIWLSLASVLLLTLIIAAGSLRRVDTWLQDELFQHPGVTSGDIVIIGIDDEAFDLLGPYYTWDRNIIASVLEALAQDPENRPAVTAIDVLYAGDTNSAADERLAEAARALGNVVTASMAEFGENIVWQNGRPVVWDPSAIIAYEQPYEALRACTVQGHINAVSDKDGVMRHAILSIEPEGETVWSMAFESARLFLARKGEEPEVPPVSAGNRIYVPFTSGPGGYSDGVSVAAVLEGRVPPQYWAGKIVLIGPYAAALQDAFFTSVDKEQQMYGIEFQANVIQSLLDRNFKKEISDLPQLICLFVICAVLMFIFLRFKVLLGGAVCAGAIILGPAASLLLYKAGLVVHVLWLPAAALTLYVISLAAHYILTLKERQALALENERISAELSLAARIQNSSLPAEIPSFPERETFEIYASMTPSKEVGGDLYDYFLIDDDHLGLVIGDVSGKGVPASLFMMVSSALLRHTAMQEKDPGKILQMVNNVLCDRNPEEMFVTVWLGILELSTGRLTCANAGHEYPVLKKAGGSFELLKDKHGFVVGGMKGIRYRNYELILEPGSKFFVYTDGIPEATDSQNEMFGTERMLESLRGVEEESPEKILGAVKKAALAFTGSAPQFDDMTMLCLEYKGRSEA